MKKLQLWVLIAVLLIAPMAFGAERAGECTVRGVIDGDTIEDYAVLSTGGASGGNQLFSARVAGFELGEGCAPNNESRIGSSSSHKKCVTSAFFGGSTNAVPLPATAWLFGTGFLGAALRARRRK